jgi:exopolysaccharide biosynthesis polyprenyl glycosylphosphotransferase
MSEVARRIAPGMAERRLILAVFDVAILSVTAAIVSWQAHGPGQFPLLAPLLAATWLTLGQNLGMYELATASRLRPSIAALVKTAIGVAFLLLCLFYLHPYVASRPKLLELAGGGPAAIGIWRLLYVRLSAARHFSRRILIAGAGPDCVALLRTVRAAHGHGVTVVGLLDDDPTKRGTFVEGVRVLDDCSNMAVRAVAAGVEEVVLAIDHPNGTGIFDGIAACRDQGIGILPASHLMEEVTGQVPVKQVGQHWLDAVPVEASRGGLFPILKRTGDVMVSVLGILLASPIMLVVAALVWATSRGPILYSQTRVGLNGHYFKIVKFRTMRIDAEKDGAQWAVRNDPRTTAVGRWLRRTHLDELPQLFLVLSGKMSVVGPRPERPEFVQELERELPLYSARHSVRPGVTGWAQVQWPYGATKEDALIKLRYDLYYVKHRSAVLDLEIVVRTAARVLGLKGR